jgi:hypothetical protein
MNIGFESFTAVHENQQCGTDASTEIIYLGNISSCMLGHVAHNSGSQAALLDFCLTNLPRAAPQSPGVYPFQPKTVTMTAICRGAVKCVRREEVLDWMPGYCNVAMHFTFFSKDVERSVSSSTQSSSLHNIRSRNAPSGQLWDCLYQSSITRTKKGTETTPYAGSLRTGQLSSLMCPIAPLEHHWAWACHVPMDAQTLSQSLIFLELTLQFLKGQQLRHGSEAGPIPVFWLAFLPFGFLGFVRILPFCLALLLACAMCVWILSWHSWLLLGLCLSPFQSTATESATQHGQRW